MSTSTLTSSNPGVLAPAGAHSTTSSQAPPRLHTRRKRRRWPWILLILVLAVGGAVAFPVWHAHQAARTAAAIDPENIATVALGDVEKSINSSCKVIANLEVEIKCRASGEVKALPVDISQNVKAGDLLCQLDPTDEKLAVRSAEAAVAQSTARAAQARLNLQQAQQNLLTTRKRDDAALASAKVKAVNLRAKAARQTELAKQHLGSTEDMENAQTDAALAEADLNGAEVAIEELGQQEIQCQAKAQDVRTAEAQLQQDQINLDIQKQQLAYTTVNAPIDGTVSSLNVQLGTMIASGTTGFSSGTTIMTLSDLSRIFVIASVDSSDIGEVRVGQQARVTVDSFPNRTFAGKVVRLAVKGTTASNVVTFEVKVEVLDDHKDLLKPEMSGNVTIVEDQRHGVLMIPVWAIIHRNGQTLVKIETGGDKTIKLGLQGPETAEVAEGLSAGERIVSGEAENPSRWKNDKRGSGGPPPP